MTRLFCHQALLPDGWADNVRLTIDAGRIATLERDVRASDDDEQVDCVIPGMPNAHSHAFQRALAGWTEVAAPAGRDNFWTWRERMYAFAEAMTPDRLRVIARQAYVEMVSSGYTSVAEFHYLHRSSDGDGAMLDALVDAAAVSGIRLAYVPVHYERSGFGQAGPAGQQRLFAQTLDDYLAHVENARTSLTGRLSVAAGAHSLRAVKRESLDAVAEFAKRHSMPMHIHIAEQTAEVEQCLAARGARPVQWLLDNADVDSRWCLVHATHVSDEELARMAALGAIAGLCPSTEANLGDGLFPLAPYLKAGGSIAIGSDSHVTLQPFEELRWLEYGQRLQSQCRNVATTDTGGPHDNHTGFSLFQRSIAGGAAACGQVAAGLQQDGVADLVSLDINDPMLAAHGDATRLDALVFSGYRLPIDRVMVDGEWCVVDGQHIDAEASARAYAHVVRDIQSEWGSAHA